NCTGNFLVNCKDAINCFDSMNLWTAKNCTQVFIHGKDCMDAHECGECELLYECNNSGYNAYNMKFCVHCMNQISDLEYCDFCFSSHYLFGCMGLKRNKFCILNKQYTEEEYKKMREKIIEHMKKTGEWGEYFPISLSSFAYNLSGAQEWYPLTKEEILAKGYKWREPDKKEYKKSNHQIPDDIKDTPENIVKETLACIDCGRNYKITEREYSFYIRHDMSIPRKCFHCRHENRLRSRPGRKLYNRVCKKCSEPILTAYSPDRPEIIYCEKCYLSTLN
ncbi:MAG: hypothetical protein WC269_00780, partial [Candidatus Gracilibacteria bacterium]